MYFGFSTEDKKINSSKNPDSNSIKVGLGSYSGRNGGYIMHKSPFIIISNKGTNKDVDCLDSIPL